MLCCYFKHNKNTQELSDRLTPKIYSYNVWMRQTQQDADFCPHNFLVDLQQYNNEYVSTQNVSDSI